jgi:hypothetical protein
MPEIGRTISHFRLVEKFCVGTRGKAALADDTTVLWVSCLKLEKAKPFWKEKEPTMIKFFVVLSIAIFAVLAARSSSRAQGTAGVKAKVQSTQFEVLSPWADVDPIPLRGISPRIDSLAGKKIGLYVNTKRAAMPIAESIQKRLKTMYPDIQFAIFRSTTPNVNQIETNNKEKFTAWAKGVDAVIGVVGD